MTSRTRFRYEAKQKRYREHATERPVPCEPLTQVSSNSTVEMFMRAECVGRGCTPGKISYAFQITRGSGSSDNYVQSRRVVIQADNREFNGEKPSDQERELFLREGNINYVVLNRKQVENLLASEDIKITCAGQTKNVRGGLRRQMEEMTRQIMEGRSKAAPMAAQ